MEFVEVFDKKGNDKNYQKERYEPFTDEEYARVVHMWIKNSEGKYLVQQRSKDKIVDPLFWSMTTGTADPKEDIYETAIRETKEEIAVELKKEELKKIADLVPIDNDNPLDNHIATVFIIEKDIKIEDLKYQESEVKQCAYWTKEEILKAVKDNVFTDFNAKYNKYFDYIFK